MTTTVLPWAIGNRITGSKLNNQGTAITEQQSVWANLGSRVSALEAATALCYNGTVSATESVGGWGYFGTWPTDGGYNGTTNGVWLPTDGIYVITLSVSASSGAWNGRTVHTISTGGSTLGSSSTTPGVGEDSASVSCVTWRVGAGTFITPTYLHSSGTNRSVGARMTIVRLST